jgi:type I restriction enzyme, S subunit
MVRVTDVKYGALDLSNTLLVDDATYSEFSRRYKPVAGDIVITRVGTYGVTARVTGKTFCLGQNTAAIIPKSINSRYLYAALNSEFVRAQIEAGVVGSTQKTLSLKHIKALMIPRCGRAQEAEIASTVGALDDRITLLRETNATLEAIAQALFRSWFVDFDPVHAKMQGRPPEGMDESTAALFPDSFEDSELGAVPRGWRVHSFRETIQIIGGGTPKTSNPVFWSGDIPWFSVVDAPAPSDVFVVDTEKRITQAGLNGSSTKLLPTGTTIISARGTVGRLALTGRPMTMNQSCYGLRGLAGDSYFTYFSTKRLVEQLKQRAHGSVFDTITQESFSGVLVSTPDSKIIHAFESSIDSLMLRIRENLTQTQTLATLRDTLLPRLISGALRLPEAESLIEAVA